jgi:hypothetical protein
VTVTDFKPQGLSSGKFKLIVKRSSKTAAVCIEGDDFEAQECSEGAVTMNIKIYFHDDGKPDKKNVRLELINDDIFVAKAKFNIGVFYDGEP